MSIISIIYLYLYPSIYLYIICIYIYIIYIYIHNLSVLSLIHISEPTRPLYISYAVFCLKKKN